MAKMCSLSKSLQGNLILTKTARQLDTHMHMHTSHFLPRHGDVCPFGEQTLDSNSSQKMAAKLSNFHTLSHTWRHTHTFTEISDGAYQSGAQAETW